MRIEAKDVGGYLAKLPPERRDAIARVRDVINANLPTGYEEKLMWGMITWCVPESVLPAKEIYNKQPLCFAGLASQKNHMAVYLMSIYGSQKERSWFQNAFKQAGKKLDMGGSCVRFKSVDALPLEVIGEAISHVPVEAYVETYRQTRGATKTAKAKAPKGKAKTAATSAKAKPAKAKPSKKPTKKPTKKRGR
jgi:hypothetical protein